MIRGRVKGAAIREFYVYLRRKWGGDDLEARLSRLPPRERDQFDVDHPSLNILPSTWYAMSTVHALLDVTLADLPEPELSRRINEATGHMMRVNLGGRYQQFFFRIFLSPKLYTRHGQKLWNLHFDGGSLSAHLVSDTELLWQMRDWSGYHPLLHRIVIASEPHVFGSMGLKNVRASAVEPAPGVVCSHSIRWDPKG